MIPFTVQYNLAMCNPVKCKTQGVQGMAAENKFVYRVIASVNVC